MSRSIHAKPNEVLILEARLAQRKAETHPHLSDDDYFLLDAIDTVLKSRGLSYQQIEEGITEGTDDGGIDAVYTFLNGILVEDGTIPSPNENCRIELEVVQSKNESGFKEAALQRLIDHLPLLLQLDPSDALRDEFNEKLLERFSLFRDAYIAASTQFPDFTLSIRYVTRSVDPPNVKVLKKAERLEAAVQVVDRRATSRIDFVGAHELNTRARERLTTVLDLRASEQPLSAEKGGYVCLVSLREWFQFISDDEGRLRESIFDENVRGYAGLTRINRAISASLEQGDDGDADFWWLNNGVTVLARRIRPSYKTLTIDDPQIVNGLQTSRTLYNHYKGQTEPDESGRRRHLLVRIIEASDDALSSQIIKATNSQNQVSTASLRATEPLQRDIEEFFGQKGYFYERKKNEYKNQKKPRTQIVEVLEVAQAVAAIILCEPQVARGQPSTLLRDSHYSRVFNRKVPFKALLNCVVIMRKVDEYLEHHRSELNRQGRGNVRFQLARAATAFALSSSRPKPTAVAALDPHAFLPFRLEPAYEWVLEARAVAEEATGVKDTSVLAKSAEWSRRIDQLMSRYTAKNRWPKKTALPWEANSAQ